MDENGGGREDGLTEFNSGNQAIQIINLSKGGGGNTVNLCDKERFPQYYDEAACIKAGQNWCRSFPDQCIANFFSNCKGILVGEGDSSLAEKCIKGGKTLYSTCSGAILEDRNSAIAQLCTGGGGEDFYYDCERQLIETGDMTKECIDVFTSDDFASFISRFCKENPNSSFCQELLGNLPGAPATGLYVEGEAGGGFGSSVKNFAGTLGGSILVAVLAALALGGIGFLIRMLVKKIKKKRDRNDEVSETQDSFGAGVGSSVSLSKEEKKAKRNKKLKWILPIAGGLVILGVLAAVWLTRAMTPLGTFCPTWWEPWKCNYNVGIRFGDRVRSIGNLSPGVERAVNDVRVSFRPGVITEGLSLCMLSDPPEGVEVRVKKIQANLPEDMNDDTGILKLQDLSLYMGDPLNTGPSVTVNPDIATPDGLLVSNDPAALSYVLENLPEYDAANGDDILLTFNLSIKNIGEFTAKDPFWLYYVISEDCVEADTPEFCERDDYTFNGVFDEDSWNEDGCCPGKNCGSSGEPGEGAFTGQAMPWWFQGQLGTPGVPKESGAGYVSRVDNYGLSAVPGEGGGSGVNSGGRANYTQTDKTPKKSPMNPYEGDSGEYCNTSGGSGVCDYMHPIYMQDFTFEDCYNAPTGTVWYLRDYRDYRDAQMIANMTRSAKSTYTDAAGYVGTNDFPYYPNEGTDGVLFAKNYRAAGDYKVYKIMKLDAGNANAPFNQGTIGHDRLGVGSGLSYFSSGRYPTGNNNRRGRCWMVEDLDYGGARAIAPPDVPGLSYVDSDYSIVPGAGGGPLWNNLFKDGIKALPNGDPNNLYAGSTTHANNGRPKWGENARAFYLHTFPQLNWVRQTNWKQGDFDNSGFGVDTQRTLSRQYGPSTNTFFGSSLSIAGGTRALNTLGSGLNIRPPKSESEAPSGGLQRTITRLYNQCAAVGNIGRTTKPSKHQMTIGCERRNKFKGGSNKAEFEDVDGTTGTQKKPVDTGISEYDRVSICPKGWELPSKEDFKNTNPNAANPASTIEELSDASNLNAVDGNGNPTNFNPVYGGFAYATNTNNGDKSRFTGPNLKRYVLGNEFNVMPKIGNSPENPDNVPNTVAYYWLRDTNIVRNAAFVGKITRGSLDPTTGDIMRDPAGSIQEVKYEQAYVTSMASVRCVFRYPTTYK